MASAVDITPRRLALLADLADRERARPGADTLPVDVDAICAWHGIIVRVVDGDLYAEVERLNLDGVPLSGVFDFTCGQILVRGDQPPHRQRFTIAHELGHHLIDDHLELYGGAIRYTVTGDGGEPRDVELAGAVGARADAMQRAEAEADMFAGLLLMPPALVDAAVADLGPSVPRLAARFGVSCGAMRRNATAYLPAMDWV